MGRASREYCKKTPLKNMGFTQRASCRAQGFIPRVSKENKGKYIKSPKYSFGKSLYSSGNKKPRVKTGYANKEKAEMTLKNIKKEELSYQLQVVNTMYNRAKYHKYQTEGMKEAMKIFKNWLKKKGY